MRGILKRDIEESRNKGGMQMYEMNSLKYIKVTELNVVDNKLSIKIDCSEDIKKYFLTDYLYVEYDQNVTNVGKSILSIPIVSNIITIAWAVGADIYVEELDKTYLDSLSKIKPVFKKWYPQFSFSTNLNVENIVSNQFNGEGYGLFFSGGIDSMTSFIRYKDKHPDLFTIWGADIPVYENDFWEKVRNRISLFSNREGVNVHFIKTNMQQLLNQSLLARQYKLIGWWGPVSHGLMLLSLVTPLTTKGIGTILIAASHTQDLINKPWGSHPLIDNNIAWADVRVVHDGYELNRHEKMRYIMKHPEYLPQLRVCYSSHSDYNCGRCEKCLRTITALILEGVNPKNCNFNINDDVLCLVKNNFTTGRFHLTPGQISFWQDIQKHIPEQINEDTYGSKEFFTWLKGFDILKYRTNRIQHFLWMISYLVAEDGMMKTIRKAPSFIARRLKICCGVRYKQELQQ
jgi:hypothetical protein